MVSGYSNAYGGGNSCIGLCSIRAFNPNVNSILCANSGSTFIFLADGFLFCRKQRSESGFHYDQYIIRSAKRLLFPWVILSVFYALMRAAFEYGGYLQEKVIIGRDMQDVLIAIYSSSIAPQM